MSTIWRFSAPIWPMLACCVLWVLMSVPVLAQQLVNQADLSWQHPDHAAESLRTNAVIVQLQNEASNRFGFSNSNQQQARAGSRVVFAHLLSNQGDAARDFLLDVDPQTNAAATLADLNLIHDVNRNGVWDEADVVLSAGQAITLAGNTSAQLLLVADLANQAQADDVHELLIAVSDGQTVIRQQDVIQVVEQIHIVPTKQVNHTQAEPGQSLSYSIALTNNSNRVATGIAITIDGQARNRVLLRDAIPANTTFEQAGANGAQLLYHLRGAPAQQYQTALPADLAQVGAVAVAIEQLVAAASMGLNLQTRLHDNARGQIVNQALLRYAPDADAQAQASNTVVTDVINATEPEAGFEPGFQAGDELAASLNDAACNQDGSVVETLTLLVSTEQAADQETFTLRETNANSGVFSLLDKAPSRTTGQAAAVPNNGIVELYLRDVLQGVISGCGADRSFSLLIDPAGVVFDSRTDQPLAGAVVTLIDVSGNGNGGQAGQNATVFASDGVTPAPSTVTTGADGRFEFPQVPPSTYRLDIQPPASYDFPSTQAADQLQPGRRIHPSGSYGGNFEVNQQTGAVFLDVPLDYSGGGLLVTVNAQPPLLAIGDISRIEITASNLSGSELSNGQLVVDIPAGFQLAGGNVQLNGQTVAVDASGGQLLIDVAAVLGPLLVDANLQLQFDLIATAGARSGDVVAVLMADLPAGATLSSNTGRNRLQIRQDDSAAYLVGKVFVDCNADGIQGHEEPGIPAVRLYLEDGSFVITDGEGAYSFYGLSTGTHVLKLDATSLPTNAVMVPIDFRHAGDGHSRFVDLKSHELHKANFAEGSCRTELIAEVARRRLAGEVRVAAQPMPAGADGAALPLERDRPLTDPSRLVLQHSPVFRHVAEQGATSDANVGQPSVHKQAQCDQNGAPVPCAVGQNPVAVSSSIALLDPKKAIADLDNRLRIVNLNDGDRLPLAQTSIRISGPRGATLSLLLNGQPVSEQRLGSKLSHTGNDVQLLDYVALPLQVGPNQIQLQMHDAFGNARGEQAITVYAPGKAARLQLSLPNAAVADGHSLVPVTVQLLDEHDTPVTARTLLTLEATLGQWQGQDLDKAQPGVQRFIEGGQLQLQLQPPQVAGNGRLRISAGPVTAAASIAYTPELRPLIAVGLVEGQVALNRLHRGHERVDDSDVFERRLKVLAQSNDERLQASGRAAIFLKGKVKGDYLLTLAYDSDKDEQQLFRDIQPDKYYPIYGDASVRGFEARSTSRLYVRLEQGNNYLLIGDFNTRADGLGISLARYERSMNGLQVHHEGERHSVTAWGSRGRSQQRVDELAGQGVSGPYQVPAAPLQSNSESVEILTRDREQPDVILSVQRLQRHVDYQLDPFTGVLVMRRPVPSVDARLNPVSIRISYETQASTERHVVAGADATVKLTEQLQLGAKVVHDDNPDQRFDMASVHLHWQINTTTQLAAELVRTDAATGAGTVQRSGYGQRLELRHQGPQLKARVAATHTDEQFSNTASGTASGREDVTAQLDYRLSDATSLQLEARHSRADASAGNGNVGTASAGQQHQGLLLGVSHKFEQGRQLALAIRHSRRSGGSAAATPAEATATNGRSTSVLARLSSPVPGLPAANVYGEAEVDVRDSQRKVLAVGGDYRLSSRTRVYGRHEFASTLGQRFALTEQRARHNSVLGIDSDYGDQGHVFSEYRARNAINGQDAEAAIGLRNSWAVTEGLRLHGSFERISSVAGQARESTAIATAMDYSGNRQFSASARLEYRHSEQGDSWLSTFGVARKLSRDFSLLSRNILSVNDSNAGSALWRDRFQIGLAWRQSNQDVFNGLARYELELEKQGTRQTRLHLLSTHLHYQPVSRWWLSGHVGGKWRRQDSEHAQLSTQAWLLMARSNYRFTERLDGGLHMAGYFTDNWRQRRAGLGIEAGYLVWANLWLAGGYNVSGFSDPGLLSSEYSQSGPYLRIRFKFDENLLLGRDYD